ncbi:MAG: serine hydrolase domain-containing protein [Eubacteriales bacterium]
MKHEFKEFDFPRASPESEGIPSGAINAYLDRIKELGIGIQGFILMRRGNIVSEMAASPYKITDRRHVYSISKSWCGAAIGIARDEGLLSLYDKVISFFPDKLPETVSENLSLMTVADLLSMSSGHETDSTGACLNSPDGDWVKTYLAYEVKYRPGTHWCYDSANQYMLCAIIERVAGVSALEYLRPRLLSPLGIRCEDIKTEDGIERGVEWDRCPRGICEGGWGIHVSPVDMLKLGSVYLNDGMFNGKRIFSRDWARRASAYHTENSGTADWSQGYGYTLWRCQHQCFRGDGAFGQLMVVLPEQEAVWIQTAEDNRFQDAMDAFWELVYPRFNRSVLPENEAALSALRKTEQSFEFQTALCGGEEKDFDGEYKVEGLMDVEKIMVKTEGKKAMLCFLLPEGARTIWAMNGGWRRGIIEDFPSALYEWMLRPESRRRAEAAATFKWEGNRLCFKIQFIDSPHGQNYVFDFDEKIMNISGQTIPDGKVGIADVMS